MDWWERFLAAEDRRFRRSVTKLTRADLRATGTLAAYAEPITQRELLQLRRRWYASRNGPVQLIDPLPRPVRLRLAVEHRIDGAAIWLVEHRCSALAVALWKGTLLWRR